MEIEQMRIRITEQDAGEILLSYGVEYLSVLSWIESKGRALLKKLNMVGVN